MKQFTKEQAIEFAKSGAWKNLTMEARAHIGMKQKLLCMPFDALHEAVEKTLGRPVYTHEFGLNYDGLIAELDGKSPPPSLDEIIKMVTDLGKEVILIM